MRFQAWVLFGQVVFFAIAAAIYGLGGGSTSGIVLLLAAAGFGLLGGAFLLGRSRAEPDIDESPVVGRFPTGTVTAPLLAVAAVLLGNGLILGRWLIIVGTIVLLVVVALYAFEYGASGDGGVD